MWCRTKILSVPVRRSLVPLNVPPTLDYTPVEKFIEKNRLPHLLFYGPPGTGKTSTILAVARRIYGPNYKKQILEVRSLY